MKKTFTLFLTALVLFGTFSPFGFEVNAQANLNSNLEPLIESEAPTGYNEVVEQSGGQFFTQPSNTTAPAAGGVTGANGVTQYDNTQGGKASSGTTVKPPTNIGCVSTWPPFLNLDACVANIVYMVMWVFSWILWIAGKILDMSLYYTLNMGRLIENVPVVDIGWKIFRDLANIFFIFILLWIALSTILGLNSGKTKELISHLVIVALLINFSLFITKTVIDASNIVALHFYELITTNKPTNNSTTGTQYLFSSAVPGGSFSGAFMEGLKIQTLYDSKSAGGQAMESTAQGGFGTFAVGAGGIINFGKIILTGLLGIILMLTAAYVFFVAAILFIIRVVVLMMLMLLSPLAFLAYVLPSTETYWEKWKESLVSNCLFAPIYLALSFVVVKTIQSPAFQQAMSIPTANDSLASVFDPTSTGGFAMLFNFILLIALMLGSILIAKKMEAYGVEAAVELGNEAKGFVGRNIMRGKYMSAAGGIIGGTVQGMGAVVGRVPGLKNVGDKLSTFGKKTVELGDKGQKKMDINEWDKKFKQSKFGASTLGSFVREHTTGGSVFGVKATFGGEKSVHEAYEEDEKLKNRRFAIQNLEQAEQARARLKIAEGNMLPEKPKWQDKKYKNDDGSFNQAKFDEDFQKYIDTFKPQARDYAPNKYAKEYKKADGTFDQAAFDKDQAAGKVEFNKKYRNPDGSFNQTLYDSDVTSGEAEFAVAETLFNRQAVKQPHRSSFAAGTSGDEAFSKAQEVYEKGFEKPERADYTTDIMYQKAKKIASDRDERRDRRKKIAEAEQASLSSSLNQVAPDEFADMDEHRIKELARFANLKQLKAVLASEHWTVPEKKEMIGVRWEKEIKDFESFSENVMKPYKQALGKLNEAVQNKQLQVDGEGNVQELRDDGTKQIEVDPSDGKKYATTLSGIKLLVPADPELPGDLKGWARNKMTKEEYELAASVTPTLFDNPDLVHVIRWGLTNKEFRTNENMAFDLRDRLTYIKDSDLDTIVEKAKHPDYIAEDTAATRRAAFTAAEAAATAARSAGKTSEEVEKIFRTIYARETPNDTIRRKISVSWADGRAPNELAGARGRNRGSTAVHKLVDAGIVQHFKEKDNEDISALLEHLLEDYQAEQNGEGIVSDENRDLIRYLFTDPRSKSLTRPIAKLKPELQELYRKLEAKGNYNPSNKISYKSDAWRA